MEKRVICYEQRLDWIKQEIKKYCLEIYNYNSWFPQDPCLTMKSGI